MEMDLKKLHQLVTIARLGNISRAAEELQITQPALSRSIAAFEAHFGIKIFDRGRRGATLTALGALAVADAESLLRQARTLDHNLKLYGKGDAGKVCVGMGPLVASLVLPDLGGYLLATRPRLSFQAAVKSADVLLTELRNDQIEALYAASEYFDDTHDLVITPLGHIRLSRIVRTSHPLARRRSLTMQDLADYPVLCGAEFSPRGYPGGAFICDNYHILKETVQHTDSVCISSPLLVRKELEAGELAVLTVSDDSLPKHTRICEVRRRGITPSPAAIAISGFLQDRFPAA